ncbi:MAG TPA: hypothetical protein PLC07_02785 [Bacillota bacterium]|nr:hypothetical protein [Bacillota bacterium]HPT88113.1 hypothetical protein [Bacillota bacterium]
MSKERDQQLLEALKTICQNVYMRPTPVDVQSLESMMGANVFDLSHSLNNLQRDGYIRIHVGKPGEPSQVELLRK